MDYSQTHLEDFLKSQSNRGVTSQQLLNSFVSTYNKTKKEKKVLSAVQPITETMIDEDIEDSTPQERLEEEEEEDVDMEREEEKQFDVSTKDGFQ